MAATDLLARRATLSRSLRLLAGFRFEQSDPDRFYGAVAADTEVRRVTRVVVREDRSVAPVLLFDPEHNLEDRIIGEQFLV